MIFLAIGFSVIISILSYYKIRRITSPMVLFNIIWSIVYIFIYVNLSNFYEVSNQAIIIMLVGQIFYNLGTTFKVRIGKRKNVTICDSDGAAFRIPNLIIVIQIILLCLMLPFISKAMTSILINGFNMQRYYFATNETDFFSSVQRLIYIYLIVFPLNKAICLLCVMELISKKKISLKLIISAVSMGCETIITAGRFAIVDILFCFMMVFFVMKKRGKQDKETKKLSRVVITVFVSVVAGIMLISSMRTLKDDNMLKILFANTIDYFTIGPRLLDKALMDPVTWGLNDFGCGGFTLAGLMEIVRLFFAFLHIPINLNFFGRSQEVAGLYFAISPTGKMANAFTTMYYYFMRDFSYLGLVILPFLFGLICSNIYRKSNRENSIWSAMKYSYLMLLVLYSSCWWNGIRPEYWSCFIWMCLVHRVLVRKRG